MLSTAELRCLVEVAQGKREADLYVEGFWREIRIFFIVLCWIVADNGVSWDL